MRLNFNFSDKSINLNELDIEQNNIIEVNLSGDEVFIYELEVNENSILDLSLDNIAEKAGSYFHISYWK